MPTTFLVKQTLWRLTLASVLAGCGAIPAGSGNAGSSAATGATAASQGKDQDDSVDGRTPILNLAHKAGKAALEIKFPGSEAQSLPLRTDANVDPKTANATVELVASAWSKTLLIQDTYASRPGPLSMCQAGQESFLRVIRLAPLEEVLSLKLASCRDNIELGSPGLEWHADTATLKIHWLSDVNHLVQEGSLQIGRDGTIVGSPP
jgi:hypothetical protein